MVGRHMLSGQLNGLIPLDEKKVDGIRTQSAIGQWTSQLDSYALEHTVHTYEIMRYEMHLQTDTEGKRNVWQRALAFCMNYTVDSDFVN